MAAADKPFRFPATFTFVVRSFSVLDGIGKSLSPRFDITEISAPYARGLLLEGAPQRAALQKEFNKRLGKQVRLRELAAINRKVAGFVACDGADTTAAWASR